MIADQPDFRTVVADIEQWAADWQQRADEMQQAMTAAGASETHDAFSLTMLSPTQIGELVFTDEAPETSGVQLRTALLDAMARLGVTSANSQAAAVASVMQAPEIGEQMRHSVPDELRERAGDESEGFTGHSSQTDEPGQPPELSFDEVMAWAAEYADPQVVVSDNIVETMSDVEGWDRSMLGRFDHVSFTEQLQSEIGQLLANAEGLSRRVESIEAEASSKLLTVVVNGAGRVIDVQFRPGYRQATGATLTTDFAALYQQAHSEAGQLLLQTLHGTGLATADDPTMTLLEPVTDQSVAHDQSQEPR